MDPGKRIVIGTAGHVDHGKTSLVKALTGIDTDRLVEEKRRGITIELGFAHLALGPGLVAGIVDVPGHERFVKAMAAGASGIDVVLLVIALDEGVMPQTREHLDICRLLGVPRGLIVITKADLAPSLGAEWAEMVRADAAETCRGTFLEDAPIVEVSAKTGAGLDALVSTLRELVTRADERPADGPMYLPIDRAFSLKGFGTIVTGTLLSGSIAPGDEVDLLPRGGERLRVRSVQVHGRDVERALAGQRTAVNLPGVEAAQVARGTVASRAGLLAPTQMLDVELELLGAAQKPLRHRSRLLLHLGTAQVPALVALAEGEALAPGARGYAQLRLGEAVAALPGERFILRGFARLPGRGQTVAGGRVLAIRPRKRRRGRPEATAGFAALAGTDDAARVRWLLEEAGYAGLSALELFARTALPEKSLGRLLEILSSRGEIVLYDRDRRAFASAAVVERLARRVVAALAAHHQAEPLSRGLAREELRQRLGDALDARLFARLLVQLVERGEIAADGETLRLSGHAPEARGGDEALRGAVADALAEARLCPPYLDELARRLGAPPAKVTSLLKLLEQEGKAVRVTQDMYFDAAALAGLRERLVVFLKQHERITTQQFKELVSATRKYTIPLSEYFDREKVTLRVGEVRVLRGAR